MKTLNKDARGFVEGVIKYVKSDGTSPTARTKIRTMLSRVSQFDRSQNRAELESAVALDKKEKDSFSRLVETLAGHSVDISWSVTPGLLGGYRLTIGDFIMDDSLVNQLSQIQSVLL